MGNGEQFCLRWNDFQESILSTLQDIRAEEDFVDVTLVCDGEEVRAHKLILSACSDFFRRLLKRNPAPNPVIVLWDISIEDMRNILRFMYNGEVEVLQTNLNPFLSVAERLRVRGLCQSGGKTSPEPNASSSINHPLRRSSVSPRPSSSSQPSKSGIRRSSSPAHQNRRSSVDNNDYSPVVKKSKTTENFSIKEESQIDDVNRHSPNHHKTEAGGGNGSGIGVGSLDENRSGDADSDNDYAEYGYGPDGYDDQSLPSALMGMHGRGLLDPATAKELWRRAAMAQINLASNSGGSPPNLPFRSSLDGSSPTEPARRQRSVYSSQQIAQLESYFQVNEYIDGERKRQLSILTNIPEQQIKVWFQNRRQKKKREQEEAQHIMQQQQNPDLS